MNPFHPSPKTLPKRGQTLRLKNVKVVTLAQDNKRRVFKKQELGREQGGELKTTPSRKVAAGTLDHE